MSKEITWSSQTPPDNAISSLVANYYGVAACWTDGIYFWLGLENWDGWSSRQVSAEFYAAWTKEFSTGN